MTQTDHAPFWYQDSQNRARLVLEALRHHGEAELAMRERDKASTGLGDTDLTAMRYLLQQQRAGRQVTPAALSDHLGITRPSVTMLIDRLCRAGHVRRHRAPLDRRSTVLVVREPEDAVAREILIDMDDRVARCATTLSSADAAIVMGFLSAMCAAVDDDPAPEQPAAERRSGDGDADADTTAAVLRGLTEYRDAEQRMRRRTRDSMHMGENDLRAVRYLLRSGREGSSVNASELASALVMKSSSVTAMLHRLSASGHVDRQPHPSDRRSVVVVATPAAAVQVRAGLGSMHERMIAVPAALDEHSAVVVERFLSTITLADAAAAADPIAVVDAVR